MGVEGVCDFEVVGYEGGKPLAAGVGAGVCGGARDGDVCAAVVASSSIAMEERGFEGAYAEKYRPLPVKMVM